MRTIETLNPLNPLQITELANNQDVPSDNVLIIGGWEQNHRRMAEFQDALLMRGVGSAAFSGFDTVGPTLDEESARNDDLIARLCDRSDFFASLPPRMLMRATQVLKLTHRVIAHTREEWGTVPSTTVTHCAGANVYLLARLVEQELNGTSEVSDMTSRAILLEPMISEGRDLKTVAKQNAQHEKLAVGSEEHISLKGLRHPDAVDLGMKAAAPFGDILNSRGLTLLGMNATSGLKARVVLGYDDIAAPEDLSGQISGLALDIPVTHYPIVRGSRHRGHGYLFAEPKYAADYVRSLL